MAGLRVTFGLKVGRLTRLWQPGDSVIVGKALLGRMRKRIAERHLGSDDRPLRPYSPRYAAWKSAEQAWLATRIAEVAARRGGRRRKRGKMTVEERERRKRARQASRGAAKFAAGTGASESGDVPVTLVLRRRHLRRLAIGAADDQGFWIEAPAPYADVLERQRPHLEPSPSDLRAVRSIAVRILRGRLKAMGVPGKRGRR